MEKENSRPPTSDLNRSFNDEPSCRYLPPPMVSTPLTANAPPFRPGHSTHRHHHDVPPLPTINAAISKAFRRSSQPETANAAMTKALGHNNVAGRRLSQAPISGHQLVAEFAKLQLEEKQLPARVVAPMATWKMDVPHAPRAVSRSTSRTSSVSSIGSQSNAALSMIAPWSAVSSRRGQASLMTQAPPRNSAMFHESRFKTELCRQYDELGACDYGDRCMYAHGVEELKQLPYRHPKFKTERCSAFHDLGYCMFGPRCSFVHHRDTLEQIVQKIQQDQEAYEAQQNLLAPAVTAEAIANAVSNAQVDELSTLDFSEFDAYVDKLVATDDFNLFCKDQSSRLPTFQRITA